MSLFHYAVLARDHVILVTCSCSQPVAGRYEPIFDAAMKSVEANSILVEHRADGRKSPLGESSMNDASPDFLGRRVCADVNGTDPVDMIEWMCRGHSRVDFDEATLSRRNMHAEWGLGDIEARFIIAWNLHLLNASGRFEGTNLHVSAIGTGSHIPTNDMFGCYGETNGFWVANLVAKLEKPYELPLGVTNFTAGVLVAYILQASQVGTFLVDPSALESQTPISLKAGVRTCSEILGDVCHQAGLEYRIQGGLVYVTTKARKPL